MIEIPSQTTNEYDHISGSNPSLITACLPSGSIMTSRLIQPPSTITQNHHLNQNRATDTQPITLNSQKTDHSQCTTLSHRTISDTYLNLSRKDINDVMTALYTLAQYVQNDIANQNQQHIIPVDDIESHHLTMLYSKSTNHTFKSSTQANSSSHHYFYYHPPPPPPPRYSRRNRRHSLSSDRCLNHHHHIKHHRNLVEEFQHDLYHMKSRQERQILRQLQYYQKYFNHHNSSSYPSYRSNARLHTSTHESNIQAKQTYHCSRPHQSTIKIPLEDQYQQSIKRKLSSSIPLSSYALDKFIYIDQQEPISNIQMLPQQAQTLQILQNNYIHSLMSSDSLNTKDMIPHALKSGFLEKLNHQQISGMGDHLNLNKIDVATQWSLQILTPKCIEMNESQSDSSSKYHDDQNNLKLHGTPTNSTILTELNRSTTTIATNNSAVKISLISKTQSVVNHSSPIHNQRNAQFNNDTNEICSEKSSLDQNDLTKSETERFLTSLHLPTCKCSTMELQTRNTNAKQPSIDDNITCISFDNDSSSSSFNKKKTKQTSIKFGSKRPRHHTSKSSKNNQIIKRSRLHRHFQSNNQSIIVNQSCQTTDRKEDSSFDFFDIDTTFSDECDRLFTDTTTSEKSSSLKHID